VLWERTVRGIAALHRAQALGLKVRAEEEDEEGDYPGWWYGGQHLSLGDGIGKDDEDEQPVPEGQWVHAVQALREPPKPADVHERPLNDADAQSRIDSMLVSTATQVAIQNEYYHVHPEVAKGRQAQPQSRVSHESVSEETGVPRLNAEVNSSG